MQIDRKWYLLTGEIRKGDYEARTIRLEEKLCEKWDLRFSLEGEYKVYNNLHIEPWRTYRRKNVFRS